MVSGPEDRPSRAGCTSGQACPRCDPLAPVALIAFPCGSQTPAHFQNDLASAPRASIDGCVRFKDLNEHPCAHPPLMRNGHSFCAPLEVVMVLTWSRVLLISLQFYYTVVHPPHSKHSSSSNSGCTIHCPSRGSCHVQAVRLILKSRNKLSLSPFRCPAFCVTSLDFPVSLQLCVSCLPHSLSFKFQRLYVTFLFVLFDFLKA